MQQYGLLQISCVLLSVALLLQDWLTMLLQNKGTFLSTEVHNHKTYLQSTIKHFLLLHPQAVNFIMVTKKIPMLKLKDVLLSVRLQP